MLASFTLNILLSAMKHTIIEINNPGLITFGMFNNNPYHLWELPIFAVIAVVGGLIGASFN